MRILALTHEEGPCAGVFATAAAERGDVLEEWSLAWETPPVRPLDEYEAVFAFGGVMNTHEEHYHPWLREENLLIQRFLDQGVPFLGICLGGQLLAKAAHTSVTKATEPEIGWHEIELLDEAAHDPIFRALPPRFTAFQWHHYEFGLPGGAVPLARSRVCLQAYRLGNLAWGLQFHCEPTREMLLDWIAAYEAIPDADPTGFHPESMREGIEPYIGPWNEIGCAIADRFLGVAEHALHRAATTSRSAATAGRSRRRSSHAASQR